MRGVKVFLFASAKGNGSRDDGGNDTDDDNDATWQRNGGGAFFMTLQMLLPLRFRLERPMPRRVADAGCSETKYRDRRRKDGKGMTTKSRMKMRG